MNLTVKLARSYRSKNGNVVFVYTVAGSKEAIEKFEAIQGDNLRKDESGANLWFTVRCIGATGKLIITTNDKVVPDMAEFDMAASMASQYGGNLGQELARTAAAKLTSGSNSPVSEPVVEKSPASTQGIGDI